jgi:hypothetical protein
MRHRAIALLASLVLLSLWPAFGARRPVDGGGGFLLLHARR